MNDPRQFLEKVIRMRQLLMRNGLSQRNVIESSLAIRALKPWLDAYPHATAAQVAAHIRRHYNAVLAIMPGAAAANGQAFQKKLNEIINAHASYQQQT